MSSALTKPKYRLVIENYFNKIASKDSLSALNTAFSAEGAYIHIPKNKLVQKPIQIIHFSTGSEAALMLQPRNLIVVGENSHVQIIERHQNLTDNAVLTNSVTEIFANKRAIVDYYKIQNDKENASLIDNTFVNQKQESIAKVHTFSFLAIILVILFLIPEILTEPKTLLLKANINKALASFSGIPRERK